MARHTSKDVHTEAARLGVVVQSWRPGDRHGTRFIFGTPAEHGGMSKLSHVCCGATEALDWLSAYAKGCR